MLYNPTAPIDGPDGSAAPTHDEGIAFTGDHLAFSGRTGALTGFPM